MEKLFLTILNMSITASYVILAVLLVRLLLMRFPRKYSFWMWGVVGIRLICPFSFESVFSIFNLGTFQQASKTGGQMEYVPKTIGYAQTPEVNVGMETVNNTVNSILPQATPVASVNPMQMWLFVFTVVWILGMMAIFLWGVISYIQTRKLVCQAVLYKGECYGVPEKVKIYECDNLSTPFVMGLFRPVIYIPFRLSDGERCCILEHEYYHVYRKDYITKFLGVLLTTVYWFNPMVWLSYFFFNRDMEMSCDEKVLSKLGSEIKKDYSTLLLAFATNRRRGMGLIAFGESDIKKRVKNILNFRHPKFWMGIAGAVIIAGIAVICLTNGKQREGEKYSVSKQYVLSYVRDLNLFEGAKLTLEEETKKFSFSYDALSSYLAYGSYEIEDNVLVARTDDGKYQYRFYVEDDDTLIFMEEDSSPITYMDANMPHANVVDGAKFKALEETKAMAFSWEEMGEQITDILYQNYITNYLPEFNHEITWSEVLYTFNDISSMPVLFEGDIFTSAEAQVRCNLENQIERSYMLFQNDSEDKMFGIEIWEDGEIHTIDIPVDMEEAQEVFGTDLYGYVDYAPGEVDKYSYLMFYFKMDGRAYGVTASNITMEEMEIIMEGIQSNGLAGEDFELGQGEKQVSYNGNISIKDAVKLERFAGFVPQKEGIGSLKLNEESLYSVAYIGEEMISEGMEVIYSNDDEGWISLRYFDSEMQTEAEREEQIGKSRIYLNEFTWENVKRFEYPNIGLVAEYRTYMFYLDCGSCYIEVYATCKPEEMKECFKLLGMTE